MDPVVLILGSVHARAMAPTIRSTLARGTPASRNLETVGRIAVSANQGVIMPVRIPWPSRLLHKLRHNPSSYEKRLVRAPLTADGNIPRALRQSTALHGVTLQNQNLTLIV